MFAPIEPFAVGYLPVTDGHTIYWETSGNPEGQAALYLHGGPGQGIGSGYRRHFDPERFLVISFEQRGSGRSRPLATEPGADPTSNNTQALLADIEALRVHLGIESWLLLGVSWGCTLALAYAQTHPKRVDAIILAAVNCLTSIKIAGRIASRVIVTRSFFKLHQGSYHRIGRSQPRCGCTFNARQH